MRESETSTIYYIYIRCCVLGIRFSTYFFIGDSLIPNNISYGITWYSQICCVDSSYFYSIKSCVHVYYKLFFYLWLLITTEPEVSLLVTKTRSKIYNRKTFIIDMFRNSLLNLFVSCSRIWTQFTISIRTYTRNSSALLAFNPNRGRHLSH